MAKVTYLFGAGASAGTEKRPGLPVVDQLPDRIFELIKEISRKNLLLADSKPFKRQTKKDYQQQLIGDLKWVAEEADKHASVDTFAKKLFLKGEKGNADLRTLKIALSIFFILEQGRKPVDVRYDAFFASILNETPTKFPEHIRILSWNYDYQFEKAHSGFSDSTDLVGCQQEVRVFSKFDDGRLLPGHFVIIKLNGTTGFFEGQMHQYRPRNISSGFDLKMMEEVISLYADFKTDTDQNLYPLLSFAWEQEGLEGETIVDKAIICTQDTDILVVIGYSFPFFNREIDRKIIGAMKNLSKVYIQSPDAEKIKTRFQTIRSDFHHPSNLVVYDEVQSFLLPDELEL